MTCDRARRTAGLTCPPKACLNLRRGVEQVISLPADSRPSYPDRVTATELKSDLVGRLDRLNQAVLHKLEGLSEYDLRRPITPTATNLLGVAFHLASLQAEYFGETFGRPFPREGEFYFLTDEGADPQDDVWFRAAATSGWVVGLYDATWEHAKQTCETLDLDSQGRIPTMP